MPRKPNQEPEMAVKPTAPEIPERAYYALTYLGHPSLGRGTEIHLERGALAIKHDETRKLWLTRKDHETLTSYEPPRWKITETKPPEDPNRRAAARAKE